ncbi:MAG: sporulation protein YqfC [Bacillota bacterium]
MARKKRRLRLAKVKRRIQHSFTSALDIPKEVLMDLPRITCIGNIQTVIENHRGVIEYTDLRVRVSVTHGEVDIRGKGLILRNIATDEIAIEGVIDSITFGN